MATNTSKKSRVDPRLLASPSGFLALGCGSGLSPWAPGTAGSLAALPLAWYLKALPWAAYAAVLLVACVLGCYVCDRVGKRLGVHDHGAIVWDEFCGLWLSVMCVPRHWAWLVLGFFIFRLCDITKPWPARWFDRHVHNGVGVMLDDLAAALWTLIILAVLQAMGLGQLMPAWLGGPI